METKFPVPSTGAKMKSVKATWYKARRGPKKENAPKHCQAAANAYTAKNDGERNRELDAEKHALGAYL